MICLTEREDLSSKQTAFLFFQMLQHMALTTTKKACCSYEGKDIAYNSISSRDCQANKMSWMLQIQNQILKT